MVRSVGGTKGSVRSDMATTTLPKANGNGHRVLPEKASAMVGAVLRKSDSEDFLAEIGGCLDFARRSVGWTLDQLACELPPPAGKEKRDPRQVQRWIEGDERCQLDVVFAVECLRGPFVIALARLAECDVETTVRIRRIV